MVKLFPRLTKCTFYKYGPSGTIETRDALCVLAQNILNEKVYIFLWFWFICLAVVTAVFLLGRLVTLMSRSCKEKILQAKGRSIEYDKVDRVLDEARLGDFFFLDTMGTNLNTVMFGSIINGLGEKLKPGLQQNNVYESKI